MSEETFRNPCTYKPECRACIITAIEDRPKMCADLECNSYTPCKICGANQTLTNKVCRQCSRTGKGSAAEAAMERFTAAMVPNSGELSPVEAPQIAQTIGPSGPASAVSDEIGQHLNPKNIGITSPGTAPRNFTPEEKEYYDDQWNRYVDFYSDVTIWAVLHQLIILEVQLNWVSAYMIDKRGEYSANLEQTKDRLIKNLTELRKQLPEKEALEQSDDEKAMCSVYKKYREEAAKRDMNGSRRIFSKEAVALAPLLHFPVDLQSLLTRMGYNTVDAITIASQHNVPPVDPRAAAEFYGFSLDEKFAIKTPVGFDTISSDLEEGRKLEDQLLDLVDKQDE